MVVRLCRVIRIFENAIRPCEQIQAVSTFSHRTPARVSVVASGFSVLRPECGTSVWAKLEIAIPFLPLFKPRAEIEMTAQSRYGMRSTGYYGIGLTAELHGATARCAHRPLGYELITCMR